MKDFQKVQKKKKKFILDGDKNSFSFQLIPQKQAVHVRKSLRCESIQEGWLKKKKELKQWTRWDPG